MKRERKRGEGDGAAEATVWPLRRGSILVPDSIPFAGSGHMEPVPSLPSKIKLHVPVRMGRWILSSNVCRVVWRLLHQPL